MATATCGSSASFSQRIASSMSGSEGRSRRVFHLDHLCRNTTCVNPAHLDPVECGENVRRGFVSRRGDQIDRIEAMYAAGVPKRRISRELGVSRHFTENVIRGNYRENR